VTDSQIRTIVDNVLLARDELLRRGVAPSEVIVMTGAALGAMLSGTGER